MNKFSDHIYYKHKVQVSSSLTISSIAMKIFLNKYYKNNIGLINKNSIYEDLKLSYFGGVTEVYKPYGENIYYYDVNSLYPYAALNSMPGSKCVLETNINMFLENMINVFGFFYCNIETTDSYLGLLPVRTAKGIIMPNGNWTGWYFSEELKFAQENGYKITVIKGYHFNRVEQVFEDYVRDFYNIKAKSTDLVEKAVAKSLLNNLLGRFGLNIYKPITDLISEEQFNEIVQSKRLHTFVQIEDMYLTSYESKISKDLCDSFDVDYKNTVLNNLKANKETEHTFFDVSIAIASAVTSYARISIAKSKLSVLNNSGKIFYSDTDSLITDTPLNKEIVGKDIGQFKLEHIVSRAYFVSSKTYCLVLSNGTTVIKAKGVNDDELDENKFIELIQGKKVISKRLQTDRDFSKGYVNILIPKEITLDGDAYVKRLKIYDKVWIDTKPLLYNPLYDDNYDIIVKKKNNKKDV